MEDRKLDDESIVLFQGETTLRPGQAELHSFSDRLFGRLLEDVKLDFKKVSRQVREMISSLAPDAPSGFTLDEVSVSLGFSATGKLVFISEASVEASVEVTFKRDPRTSPPASLT